MKLVLVIIYGVLVWALLLSSCTSEPTESSNWSRDTTGHFFTDDIKLAQKEIPFKIIVPDYVPDLFLPEYRHLISGPFKYSFSSENYVEVHIQYWDDIHHISISEYNEKNTMTSNDEETSKYHNIAGISVLQKQELIYGNTPPLEGLEFSWYTEEITYEVIISNIPEE
jgi:hypothetical protein